MFDFKIIVADIVIRFICRDGRLRYDARRAWLFKNVVYKGNRAADIVFEVKYGSKKFPAKHTNLVFCVEKGRTFSKARTGYIFEFRDTRGLGKLEVVADIGKGMDRGTIYVNRGRSTYPSPSVRTGLKRSFRRNSLPPGEAIITSIKGNFFQAFLVEYLARKRRGLLVHTAAIQLDGKLCLFMGASGAGKTTISRYLKERRGAKLLNDDRGILNAGERIPYFYNAPWTGELFNECDGSFKGKAKLDRIFFIYHSDENRLRPLGKIEATYSLFQNSFPALWGKDTLQTTLELCSMIVDQASCYSLGFVNNGSVVRFLEDELKRTPRR